MKKNTSKPHVLMGIGEVCKKTGIAKWQIYHMINSGAICDVQKVAGKRIFTLEDVASIKKVLKSRVAKLNLGGFFEASLVIHEIRTRIEDEKPFEFLVKYKNSATCGDDPISLMGLKKQLKKCGLGIIKVSKTTINPRSRDLFLIVKKEKSFNINIFAEIFSAKIR